MDGNEHRRERRPTSVSRRHALGALAGLAFGGTAGCLQSTRALATRDAPSRLSVTIKTVPADLDPRATRIARYVAERLDAVGIASTTEPMSREALYRDVLVNQQFDLYVGRCPASADPDFLRSLLHSRFAGAPGWQNPFGFADLDVDSLLERQRDASGDRRHDVLTETQRHVVRKQPFTVVAFPDEIRAVGNEGPLRGVTSDFHTSLGYVSLGRATSTTRPASGDQSTGNPTANATTDGDDGPSGRGVQMTLTDARALENLNPLAVPFRNEGVLTGLLYDPLGRRIEGRVQPWLAASWRWLDADSPTLEVSLREGLRWHDGTSLTAADVSFTYRFLDDTSLGRVESGVPAPRFRGRGTLVDDVEVVDDRTLRIRFRASSRPVARRALGVPVLPAHIWKEKAREATLAGIDTKGAVTEAVVWSNRDPVGSGPLRVADLATQETLTLEPFRDHFLTRATDAHLEPYRPGYGFDELVFQRAPSSVAAVSMVRHGDADATATGVLPSDVPVIGRSPELDLAVDRSRSFYHVGYNTRRPPFGNPRFRQAVARLVDRSYLVADVFDGYATPASTPLATHEMVAPGLVWTGEAPMLPFVGTAGEGDLDVERARQLFRDAGYRYGDDGLLTS